MNRNKQTKNKTNWKAEVETNMTERINNYKTNGSKKSASRKLMVKFLGSFLVGRWLVRTPFYVDQKETGND